MADMEFEVTSGPYAGRYDINVGDISAGDIGDLIAAGGPDLDAAWLTGGVRPGVRVFAGLVWIVKKRGGAKGLAYRGVADTINAANLRDAEELGGPAAGLPDPSGSDAAS